MMKIKDVAFKTMGDFQIRDFDDGCKILFDSKVSLYADYKNIKDKEIKYIGADSFSDGGQRFTFPVFYV